MEIIFKFLFGMFLAVVTIIIIVGGFLTLSGKLLIGSDKCREWRKQTETDTKKKSKNIIFTRKDIQEYSDKYYKK